MGSLINDCLAWWHNALKIPHLRVFIGNENNTPVVTKPRTSNQSAFGDVMAESLEPVVQISGTYGENSTGVEVFNANGGTIGETDNMFALSTGGGIGGYGVLRTLRPMIYREGQGMMARITAIFDGNAVANSLQFAGLFNLTDTIAFGYRGADFGIIYDTYGAPEIRTLAITASGNGNLTLTLNSVAYIIPITTGTLEHNAAEIETWMNANQTAWNVQQLAASVIFQARATEPRAGTYSIAGTTLAGTFSTQETGLAKTPVTILQADWNKTSPADLAFFDPTKSNVYMIKTSYLGFGPLRFFIVNTTTGEFQLVHEIMPAGTATKPSFSKRALKIGWTCASLGSTTPLTLRGASAGGFIEGSSSILSAGQTTSFFNASVGATFVSVLAVRVSMIFSGKLQLGRLVPLIAEVSNDAGKPVEYVIVKNSETIGNHYHAVADDSIAQVSDVAGLVLGNGQEVYRGTMSAGGGKTVPLKDLDIDLLLDDSIEIFARKTSGTNPRVDAALVWKEDY